MRPAAELNGGEGRSNGAGRGSGQPARGAARKGETSGSEREVSNAVKHLYANNPELVLSQTKLRPWVRLLCRATQAQRPGPRDVDCNRSATAGFAAAHG